MAAPFAAGVAGALLFGVGIAHLQTPDLPPARATFKVATWNIRSGMGVRGFGTRHWDDETLNCDDGSRPVNAWGVGLPQQQLRLLAADPSIVAVALQEAWNCASPERVNGVLGFRAASREFEGVALLARHGIRDRWQYARIDAAENRWVVGGNVCLDESCAATLPVYSTHWGAPAERYPAQARATVDVLSSSAASHVLLGDLNVYRIDRWSPWRPCAAAVRTHAEALSALEGAGYVDAWVATQINAGWTGMLSRPGCGSPGGRPFKRIDYVFTRGISPIATGHFGRVLAGADAPSDHLGLIAELRTPES